MSNWETIKNIFFDSYEKNNAEYIELINMVDLYHPEIIELINKSGEQPLYIEEVMAILRAIDNNFYWESTKPLKFRRIQACQ